MLQNRCVLGAYKNMTNVMPEILCVLNENSENLNLRKDEIFF